MAEFNQKIWIDGQPAPYGTEVPSYMRQYFNHNTNGTKDNLNYVGFHLANNELNIMLPKNSELVNDVSPDVINVLVDALRNNRGRNSGSGDANSVIASNDLFVVVEWLIQDFRANGIFAVNHKTWDRKRGKINWGRTIKKVTPFVQDDNLVLLDLIRKKRILDFDEVSQIHAAVMQQIANKFGVLFHGFSFKSMLPAIDINDRSKLNQVLNKLYTKTNVRREKLLIRNILNYLGLIDSDKTELSIVTTEFHVLFEESFKRFIGDQEELHTSLAIPSAKWTINLPGKQAITAKNKQIPDALVVRQENQQEYLDIYDTKYYELARYRSLELINGDGNPPADWYSVGKQFFYEYSYNRRAISNDLEPGKNHFVFPWPIGNLQTINAGHVEISVGTGTTQRIELLLVDPIELLREF